ncbi:MAG: hypothetical protein CVU19_07650 [Betaproteobacteria bacterium HGW-Betaproteobacteria-13]|jgi:diguanylate cyclase (GGDEF)-like protein|nr:MAG: hypothetical protein CVU25_01355 [Betaproteobacteria bacterium HGW-Betaproteobacteria-19]PKO81311.1 MAG: hypothetical protein CVU19_07650 [Betaproteobacteria bacterium HGW-Betaproteobacteria-13]
MSLFRKLSLRQRLLLVGLLPAALLATCIAGLFFWRGTQSIDAALDDRGIAIVSFLAPASEYAVISGNRLTQMGLLQAVLDQPDVTGAALFDRDGGLLAVSGRMELVHPGLVTQTEHPRNIGRNTKRIGYAAPVVAEPLVMNDVFEPQLRKSGMSERENIGWVYVELSNQAIEGRKQDVILTALSLFIIGMGLAGLLASRLASSVGKPLARLVEAVSRIGAGELDVAVADDAPSDELRALQRGFNNMAQSIAQAHSNLQARIDEATSKLAYQALHDPLTGLPNRRAFEQALENAVTRSRRSGDHATLCFIDLDRFKIVNDSCGHAAGDELLQNIARLIRQRVRTGDLISRIGGDEFALILHECSPTDARGLAESLREVVSTYRFHWEERRFTVGASIGLVRIDGRTSSASDLLVAADLACYAAKKAGRNQVVEHSAEPSGNRRKTDLPAAGMTISGAIPYQRLSLFKQAIKDLDDTVQGEWYEVLLRVSDTTGGMHSPMELLSGIDAPDALLELDLWVAEHACRLISRQSDVKQFSLNLTPATVANPQAYLPRLVTLLSEAELSPSMVILEFPARLTEQAPEECRLLFEQAHQIGMRIAIERLDGGATALLPSLHPDFVKISLKSLVESFGLEAGCNVAQALCGMAAALSIPVIASEVDDALLHDSLRDYGFNYAQGDLVVKAVPLTD